MFFSKLLPKEEKYFENFKEMIGDISEMADEVYNLFSADVPDKNIMLRVKPIESRCDAIEAKIIKRLNKTFITPFDREDVFRLVKRLDDIADMLFGAATRIEMLNITHKIKYADKLAFIIKEQISELDKAIQDLKVKSVNEMKAVKTLEVEADKIYQQALKELFENPNDVLNVIKEKEILDILENTSDKCQSTANVILAIFIKNA
ncbi:MAG: DUF47 family protein [Ignavibacteriaceae bacterium]|nr:DUF47 family protein [Ignavibacteriaceae bacterium]